MVDEKTIKVKSKLPLKIGILSISLTVQAAGAVAAAVPAIMVSFSERSTAQIQSILTIPSMAILVFIILSSWFIKKIGKRNTVLLGLIVSLVGGILPAFTTNFPLILFARVLFGAGTGLFNSLTVSLIGDNFSGQEQKTLLGIQSAVMTLGNSLATFVAGLLLSISWQASFLVYLVIIPIIIVFAVGYRGAAENESQAEETIDQDSNKQRKSLPLSVVLGIITLFLFFVGLMVIFTSSALAIQELGLKNQGALSTALAISGIINSIVAMGFGKVYQLFKKITPVIVIGLGAVGLFVMTLASNMGFFFVGLTIAYIAMLVVPYVYSVILSDVAPESNNLVVSLAMVSCNLGAFCSPYVINFLGNLLGIESAVGQIRIAVGVMIVIALIFIFLAVKGNDKKITDKL